MKKIYIFLFFVTINAWAQDLHLTQYYTNNNALNPALLGNYNGDLRLVANYRSQWGQVSKPIQTSMFGIEKKFPKYNKNELAFGALFSNDQVSALFLQSSRVLLSGSFLKYYKKNSFRFGVQAGAVNRKLNLGNQSFPDQWEYSSGTFNQNIFNGESNIQNSSFYIDFNAGIGWSRLIKKTRVAAGYGIFHLNRPKDNFVSSNKPLAVRHTFNASSTFNLNNGLSLSPNILFMYSASANDIVLGTNLNKRLNEDLSLLLGGGFRTNSINKDAGIVIAGLGYKRFDFGVSFDYNLSQLSKTTRQKSAWEISLAYTTPSIIANKITIPCDRY